MDVETMATFPVSKPVPPRAAMRVVGKSASRENLVDRAARGEVEAFEELYRENAGRVYLLCLKSWRRKRLFAPGRNSARFGVTALSPHGFIVSPSTWCLVNGGARRDERPVSNPPAMTCPSICRPPNRSPDRRSTLNDRLRLSRMGRERSLFCTTSKDTVTRKLHA